MTEKAHPKRSWSRREMLQSMTAIAGATCVAGWIEHPPFAVGAWWTDGPVGQAGQTDPLTAMRTQMGAIPIQTMKLGDDLTMLSGPGGNVAVLAGRDGLVVVDTFVQPAWPALKNVLDGLGKPINAVIDTHWHVDHSDNNARFRQAGARVIAHANTTKRLSQAHDVLGMHFDPAPPEARPTETFVQSHKIQANNQTVELGYIPPAHTDTDIYIRFPRTNVLHLGDLYFSGMYPFIDWTTGGSIAGMIRAADQALKLADRTTKIVPGHGPLSDRDALTKYRDMMATVRDRVQKLKTSGRSLAETVAAKPTADLDPTWGKGFTQPDMFVTIVFNTL